MVLLGVSITHSKLFSERCLSDANWVDYLLRILLFLQTMPKAWFAVSPMALAFQHQPLLPGCLVSLHSPSDISLHLFPCHHCSFSSSHPFVLLSSCSHVMICVHIHWPSLEPLFPFLNRNSKTFASKVRGKLEIISIHWLKLAGLPSDDLTVTHSCWVVHLHTFLTGHYQWGIWSRNDMPVPENRQECAESGTKLL